MTLPPPTVAYDLSLLQKGPARGSAQDHGWCYGLPPGLSPEQWPLSPHDGYPMQHGFTLLVPEQYRAQGPDYVALSIFADQQYDEPVEVAAVADYFASETPQQTSDRSLLPFWIHRTHRHPMEFRMKDIIDRNFAAIWLTEAEFAAPLCEPPELGDNLLLQTNPLPLWLEKGAARAVFECQVGDAEHTADLEKKYWYRMFGHIPETGHRAYGIAVNVRQGDPNVGRPPRDPILHKDEIGDYLAPVGEAGQRLRPLAGRNHLGGTMFPSQWTPKFSPTYLEIEEHFGGFNFGGGNAQLDLVTMKFEWASG